MRPSGQLTSIAWRARAQLRKSNALRHLLHWLRSFAPDTRERHLRTEVRFWRSWAASKGLLWTDDFGHRFDPEMPVQDHLAQIFDGIPKGHIELLDVGAGPVTVVGKVHPTKRLSITATDPLAREYNEVLAEFGLEPPVRTIYAEAENLVEQLPGRSFDVVHAQNSLDHSADAITGVEQMLALARPGGLVVLFHEENEGANEMYYALHKWDFSCEDGHFVIRGPGPGGPRRDITEMVAGRAEVECSSDGENVLVVMRKLPDEEASGREAPSPRRS